MFGISRHCCLLLTENVPRGVLFTKANRVIKLYVPRVNTQNGYRTHTHNHSEPPNVNNAHYAYATLRWCSACFVAYTYVLPTLTFLSLSLSLRRYQDMYNNPIKATNLEHRDVVLDILSDARVVGPLLQTGMFHADVNRRNYMYVFGHNSATGPFAHVSISPPQWPNGDSNYILYSAFKLNPAWVGI